MSQNHKSMSRSTHQCAVSPEICSAPLQLFYDIKRALVFSLSYKGAFPLIDFTVQVLGTLL